MQNHQSFKTETFPKAQKLELLFFYLSNPQSNALLAYCIKYAIEKNDHEGVLLLLKSLLAEDETVIASIYGELVLHIVKSL